MRPTAESKLLEPPLVQASSSSTEVLPVRRENARDGLIALSSGSTSGDLELVFW